MKNFEKYKNKVNQNIDSCSLYQAIYKIRHGENAYDCCNDCDRCFKVSMKWLAEEYKKPVLDDIERKYLSQVLNPFKLYIRSVTKYSTTQAGCEREFICVRFMDSGWQFPSFKKGSMYKGMKRNREYSLEELGL